MFIYISKCRFSRYGIKTNGIKFNTVAPGQIEKERERWRSTKRNNRGNRSYKQNGNDDDDENDGYSEKNNKK